MPKKYIRIWLALALIGGLLMSLAGTVRDGWLWAYLGVLTATSLYAIHGIDEDLVRERFSPPEPGADRLSLRAVRLVALAHLVVGALDSGRWHLAPVPSPIRAAALAGMAATFVVVFKAMHANRFFSPVVRIQSERRHTVVSTGPYSIVRHPGYAGMIAGIPLSGLALGSWLAALIALGYSALIVRRVRFEDNFLRRSLDGYAAYAKQVPYRLIPGVW